VDPAGYDKDMLEAQMESALVMFWQEQVQRIQAELEPRIPDERKGIQLSLPFWNDEGKRMLRILLPFLQRGAEGGAATQQAIVQSMGIDIDWTMPFTRAANWARAHAGALVKDITETTRERIRSVVGNWIETEHTLPDLIKQMQEDHAFSRARAKLIATTEATRAYTEGQLEAGREAELQSVFEYEKQWQTISDDARCVICAELQYNGKNGVVGIDTPFDSMVGPLQGSPAHPNCRCWIVTVPRWRDE